MANLSKIQKEFMRSMELKMNALKTTKFNGIKQNITPFLRQFESDQEKYTAYKLIDLIIYYNSESLYEYVRFILNELRRRLYVNLYESKGEISNEEYENEWIYYLNETIFIPLSDKGPTDGAYHVLFKLKELQKEFGIVEGNNISHVSDIVKDINNGAKRVFILDDFVGHGFQIMTKFLPHEFNFDEYKKTSLKNVVDSFSSVHFEFFILNSSDVGLENLRSKGYNFSCIDLFTDEFSILRYNNVDWNDRKEFSMFKRNVNKFVKKYDIEFEHTMNLPILFDYSSPKPSHPIYWNSNSKLEFKPLRRRQ